MTQRISAEKLRDTVEETIRENRDAARDYIDGDPAGKYYLIGRVLQLIDGRANPDDVRHVIEAQLDK